MTDIFWDEIESIEYLNPEDLENTEYVYDFSVEDVETFATKEGLIVHNTLNTFHHAGVSSKSNVNKGVPRIRELISVTKNPKTPSLTIYLNDKNNNKNEGKKILNNIENTTVRYFVKSTSLYYDKDVLNCSIEEDKEFVTEYYEFNNEEVNFEQLSPWVLRIELDHLFMVNKGMTMYEIYTFLLKKFEKKKIHIIYSEDNSTHLVFHIRFIHNNIDMTDDNNFYLTNKDQTLLNNLEEDIVNSVLRGLNNIKKVTMREINRNVISKGVINKKKQILLDTTGTNLIDIMSNSKINKNLTFSNDIYEVYNLLGVEAARQLLKNEIADVMTDSGIYINDKHLNLLVDSMTAKGGLISMDRHGISKSDTGVLTKTSFEEPHDHLVNASVFNTVDNMKSLTANLIMGQIGKFGTGMCDLIFSHEKLEKYAFKNNIQKEQKRKTINLNNI